MGGLVAAVMFWVGVPLVFIAALYGAVLAYQVDRADRSGRGRSVTNYASGVAGAGFLATLMFWFVGVPVWCWLRHPGAAPGCGIFEGIIFLPWLLLLELQRSPVRGVASERSLLEQPPTA